MSQTFIDDFLRHHADDNPDELEHYGVKGMKWGVRKDAKTGYVKARATANRKGRKNFEWDEPVRGAYEKVYKSAAGDVRRGIRAVNRQFKGEDFTKPSKTRDEYYGVMERQITMRLNKHASKGNVALTPFQVNLAAPKSLNGHATVTISGRQAKNVGKQWGKKAKADLKQLKETRKEVKHADDSDTFEYPAEMDDAGYIVDVNPVSSIEQAEEFLADFLEHHGEDELIHYGIKGMKWGVRRSDAQLRSARKQRKSEASKDPDSGGEKKTARIGSDPIGSIRKTNVKKLSDEDLRAGLERLQMEKRYRDLARPEVNAGQQMVKDILIKAGTQVATAYAVHYLGKGAAKLTKVDLKIGVNEKEKEKKDQKKDQKKDDES